MKKILFINQYRANPQFGGVQKVTFILSERLKSLGFEVSCVFFKFNNITDRLSSGLLENEYKFPSDKVSSRVNRTFLNKIVREREISVVVNQFGFSSSVLALCKHITNECIVISVLHSCPDFKIKDLKLAIELKQGQFKSRGSLSKWLYLKFFEFRTIYDLKFISKNSDFVVLLSNFYKSDFVNYTKILPLNILSIPNPVETITIPIKNSNEKKTVLFVGRLNLGKRIDLLLEIWQIIERNNKDWSFSIVGDGPERLNLIEYSKSLNLGNVIFHGQQENVSSYYEDSSIFLMTSAYEGLPMVLVESLSYGLVPIVYDTFDAVNDLIINGESGFIIPNNSQNEFVNKLQLLMNDVKLLSNFSNKALLLSENFSLDNVTQKWIDLFQLKRI